MISLEYYDANHKKSILEFSRYLIKEDFHEESLFIMKLDGKSMEPLVLHNSLVVLDLSKKNLLENSLYLISANNELFLKKYIFKDDSSTFTSINKDFENHKFFKKDVKVIAKALLTFTSL